MCPSCLCSLARHEVHKPRRKCWPPGAACSALSPCTRQGCWQECLISKSLCSNDSLQQWSCISELTEPRLGKAVVKEWCGFLCGMTPLQPPPKLHRWQTADPLRARLLAGTQQPWCTSSAWIFCWAPAGSLPQRANFLTGRSRHELGAGQQQLMAQQGRLRPPGQLATCRPTNAGKVSQKSTMSGRSQRSAPLCFTSDPGWAVPNWRISGPNLGRQVLACGETVQAVLHLRSYLVQASHIQEQTGGTARLASRLAWLTTVQCKLLMVGGGGSVSKDLCW